MRAQKLGEQNLTRQRPCGYLNFVLAPPLITPDPSSLHDADTWMQNVENHRNPFYPLHPSKINSTPPTIHLHNTTGATKTQVLSQGCGLHQVGRKLEEPDLTPLPCQVGQPLGDGGIVQGFTRTRRPKPVPPAPMPSSTPPQQPNLHTGMLGRSIRVTFLSTCCPTRRGCWRIPIQHAISGDTAGSCHHVLMAGQHPSIAEAHG